VTGELQAPSRPPSTWQRKVELGFDEVKVKVAVEELVGSAGCAVIVVSGVDVSTVQV
jgi:hypothetical protein